MHRTSLCLSLGVARGCSLKKKNTICCSMSWLYHIFYSISKIYYDRKNIVQWTLTHVSLWCIDQPIKVHLIYQETALCKTWLALMATGLLVGIREHCLSKHLAVFAVTCILSVLRWMCVRWERKIPIIQLFNVSSMTHDSELQRNPNPLLYLL